MLSRKYETLVKPLKFQDHKISNLISYSKNLQIYPVLILYFLKKYPPTSLYFPYIILPYFIETVLAKVHMQSG